MLLKNEIPIEHLSSGEKNDFVLFYELIFKCDSKSLILVDEPEISLHVPAAGVYWWIDGNM